MMENNPASTTARFLRSLGVKLPPTYIADCRLLVNLGLEVFENGVVDHFDPCSGLCLGKNIFWVSVGEGCGESRGRGTVKLRQEITAKKK